MRITNAPQRAQEEGRRVRSCPRLLSGQEEARVNVHPKITEKDQAQPDPVRECFLQGVLDEAHEQGYSKKATGRLFVVALRSWEKR
jgi:hypothetical protein